MSDQQGGEEADGGLEGRYANYFKVGHNAFEFLLDFGQFYSDSIEPLMHTRVVTSPAYAKAMSDTLLEAIGIYEQTFGFIPEADDGTSPN
jgi:hypothetical protein